MENIINSTKHTVFDSLNNLFEQLDDYSTELDKKVKSVESLEAQLDDRSKELNSFSKVSFITNLNKQVEKRNLEIDVLNKRIDALSKKNSELQEDIAVLKVGGSLKDRRIDTSKVISEDSDDEWVLKELENQKYLYNSETKKIHLILKNEKPGNIIGRISSKNQFKKYKEPREYNN
jgi:uncharacterized phage infection (PIP) family protein YhgE